MCKSLFIIILFVFIVLSIRPVSALSKLHVEGRYLKDDSNQTVTLRGVDYARFLDGITGDWILPKGGVEWSTWDPTAIGENLDAMKSWGINIVRVTFTTSWWMNNATFRTYIQDFISMADQRGIYVVLCPWRNNATEPITAPTDLPWSPYDAGNNVLNSSTDFVNFWSSVATSLKNNSNVMFDLFNEPQGNATLWFSAVQSTIDGIRSTGSTNLIVVEYGYGFGVDFSGFYYFNAGGREGSIWTLDWINNYPLSDPANNILYSPHIYRNVFYDSSQNYAEIWSPLWVNYTSDDMLWALNIIGLPNNSHPIWVGEIGANAWWTGADLTAEYNWYNYVLSFLNQHTDGFAGWWWWDMGTEMQLLNGADNYTPSDVGQFLIDKIRPPFEGKLIDKNNDPVQANITIYESGNSNVIEENQTDPTGYYKLPVPPGQYDIRFNISSIPNIYIELFSIDMFSKINDVLNYVTNYSSNLSFTVNMNDNQTVELYSAQKPSGVLINGTALTEVSSMSDLKSGAWYYESGNSSLHVIANKELKALCPFNCCFNETNYFDKSCPSDQYCSNHACVPRDPCPYGCCVNEFTYLDKACDSNKSCYSNTCLYFSDGFELGNFSAWTGVSYWSGKLAVQSAIKHNGVYALNVSNDASQAWGVQTIYENMSASNISIRLYFLLDSLPPSGKQTGSIITLINNTGTIYRVGSVLIRNLNGNYSIETPWSSKNISISTNTWYSLEYLMKIGTSGEEHVYLDGNEIINKTGINTAVNGNFNQIYVGSHTGWSGGADWPFNIYIDDVKIDDKYIGP